MIANTKPTYNNRDLNQHLGIAPSTPTLKTENKNPLFPNPVQDGILHIDAEQNIKSFEIYNLQGQLLRRQSNVEDKIQVGEFKGIVIVKLYTEKGGMVEMILIE